MLAEVYLENIKASSKFLLTKSWCVSVLRDTLAMYNSKYELNIKDVKIELSEQPRYTNGKICDNPEVMKSYGGCWTSKKIIYINPYAINVYCYICKLDINDVTIEEFHRFMRFLIAHELAHGVWEYYSNKKFRDSILESAKSDKFNTEYLDWVKEHNPDKLEEETFCEYMADSITTDNQLYLYNVVDNTYGDATKLLANYGLCSPYDIYKRDKQLFHRIVFKNYHERAAFIAAMEDEKTGFLARVKAIAGSLLFGIGQHKKAAEEEDDFEVEFRNNIQKLEQKYKSDDALIIAGSITQLFIGNKECETVLSFAKKFTDKLSSVADFSKKMVSDLVKDNSDEARKELSLLNNAIAEYRKLEKEIGVLLGKSANDKYKDKKVRVKVKVITKRSSWYYKEASEISDSLLSAIMTAGTSAEYLERAANLHKDVDTAKLCLASLGSLNNIIYSAQRLCDLLLGSMKTLRKTIANLANA